jgi:hypothetical protein
VQERVTAGGFSLKRLSRVRDVLERHVGAGYVQGAVAVVARHGEVHVEAMGTLAFEGAGSGTPLLTGSLYSMRLLTTKCRSPLRLTKQPRMRCAELLAL